MSIFQKKVDSLIKKELEALKEAKMKKVDEAKAIHKRETTQSKINRLLDEQKKEKEKENKKSD
ncbi:MAG: hypothetical protein JEZ08_25320 [Clostridiales bacterium]|nr:hypothetical protein [Clostridiales bacterium]